MLQIVCNMTDHFVDDDEKEKTAEMAVARKKLYNVNRSIIIITTTAKTILLLSSLSYIIQIIKILLCSPFD